MKKLSIKLQGIFVPVILVALFFLPLLIRGKAPIPADTLVGLYHPFRDNAYLGFPALHFPTKNPLITDPVLQTYPWRLLTIENIKMGNFPLWNPYSFSGQPLLANIQSAAFQFFNLFYFIFPFKFTWLLSIMISSLLASFFTYLFLRSLKVSKFASAYGSFILPFSGFFVAWLTWGTVITTAMWLPLILYCINKVSEKQSKLSALYFFALVFSSFQTIVSGHWQTAFYVFLAAFFYLTYKSFKSKSTKLFAFVSLTFVLGAFVSAIQILPSFEFINLSNRAADQAYSPTRQDWFLPLQNLVQAVAPDFFGNPTTYNYWGIWNYAEFVTYVGILPLFFALVSAFKKDNYIKFFWCLFIFSFLMAVKNPISQIPYALNLPFVSSMQPSRIIFLMVFSLVMLCAFGLDYFIKEVFKKKTIVPALLLFGLVLVLIFISRFLKNIYPAVENLNPPYISFRNLLVPLALSGSLFIIIFLKIFRVPKLVLVALIFVITITDVFRFAYKFTPFSNTSIIFPSTQTTNFLIQQQKPFRIMTTDRRILNGNISSVYKIEQVSGYDPLYLKSYAQLVSSWDSGHFSQAGSFNRIVTPQNYPLDLTNFMNVKYLLTFDDIQNTNFAKVFQEGETKVYENKNVLPRAYFVSKVQKLNSQKDELNAITQKDFDFSKKAVSLNYEFSGSNAGTSATIIKYTDQQIEIKTSSDQKSPLVISNANYPGWKAFIDGNPTSLSEVNFMFQSILVPAGSHIIQLIYAPKSFFYGLYLSFIALLSSLAIGGFLWKKGYR